MGDRDSERRGNCACVSQHGLGLRLKKRSFLTMSRFHARARGLVAFALLVALVAALPRGSSKESDRPLRRRNLQSSFTREKKLEWFRLADLDRQGWPEMFSVDQDTKKEITIGGVTENPWGTLCTSVAECL